MVFGHYSFPIRILNNKELPPEIRPQKGDSIEYTVRVVHILFIPIFPFSKSWTLKKGNQKYKVSPEMDKLLTKLYGKKKMPWYSFSGPLLLLSIFLLSIIINSLQRNNYQKERINAFDKNVESILKSIDSPNENDYYTFKDDRYRKIFKVVSITKDSIKFAIPKNNRNKKWSSNDWTVSYFDNPNSLIIHHQIPKIKLKKAICKDFKNQSNCFGKAFTNIMDERQLILEKIERIDKKLVEIRYIDELEEEIVKIALKNFLNGNANIETHLSLVDSSSINYFTTMLETAKTNDFQKIKALIQQSNYPLVTFKYMLYTKYSYLKTKTNNKFLKEKEELKTYAFYLKLLKQGFWSTDFTNEFIENLKIKEIKFKNKKKAFLSGWATSNILSKENITFFEVELNKEGGKWKINLPSTQQFTHAQIGKAIPIFQDNGKKYRIKVIEELEKLENVNAVGVEWFY